MKHIEDFEKVVSFDIFKYDVIVVLTKNIIKSRYKRNDLYESMYSGEQPGGLFEQLDTSNGFIFLSYKAKPGVIAHEAFHAICAMMDEIGSPLDSGSEECYAYALTFLIDEILHFMKETKQERKKLKTNVKTKFSKSG